MSDISDNIRSQVVTRASNRCEYCGLSQVGQEAQFHIDHVEPRVLGGKTALENLALACVSCSLRKWANQSAPDPVSGDDTRLFNPRLDRWQDHFRWDAEYVVPLTAKGRATVVALAMNRDTILSIRREETMRGRHPPPA